MCLALRSAKSSSFHLLLLSVIHVFITVRTSLMGDSFAELARTTNRVEILLASANVLFKLVQLAALVVGCKKMFRGSGAR